MKLRSQISLFLLSLGLIPLLLAFIINRPLVFDKLEQFYHKAYLEQLRSDFRDLDQHITRRQEIVRLFAKLPEPGMSLSIAEAMDEEQLDSAREDYIDWVNRVLFDQLDITQIIFIGSDGEVSLAMNRNARTGQLESDEQAVDLPALDFLTAGLGVAPGTVLTSPINLDQSARKDAPNRFMTLSFITPLITASAVDGAPQLQGVVVFKLDIGGLAHFYKGIYWVQDNGEYLPDETLDDAPTSNAFTDFPGLEALFRTGELGLWEKSGQQIFWLPLFTVQGAGPLWVGRSVDKSPVAEFTHQLELRVIMVIAGLLLAVYLIARLIAIRAERVSNELTSKMSRVLEKDEAVTFSWQRPEELRILGNTLTCLSEKHAHDTGTLREHAHQLEQSNQYKSEFLANVSHELRTPLNSILLLSKILAADNTPMNEEQCQQIGVIHSAGKDLRTLIDSILDLSRIEAGKATLHIGPVTLPDLLGELVELMRPQVDEKGLRLELMIEPDSPGILINDETKLRQILINFLSNALKFTEQGRITLTLSRNTHALRDELPVAISVRDTGIGIAYNKQTHVFEAFNQVDGSTSRRYGGTGLGLTISRELATLLGGRIEVHSAVGEGSTFTLLLPEILDVDALPVLDSVDVTETPAPARTSDESPPPPAASYSGHRVLLVDDDVRNLLELTPILEGWSVGVTAAGDGQEAIETLEDDTAFDLIVIDLAMPAMDGFKTVERIRQDSRLNNTPVIGLTETLNDDERQQALRCGVNDFMTTPIAAEALKTLLDRHLEDDTEQAPS